MPALTKQRPRFNQAVKNSHNGIWGFLDRLLGGFGIKGTGIIGTATITSGNTSVVVTDAGVTATDLFFVTILAKGTNSVSYVGVSGIVAGTSYTLNVSGDPGAVGVTLAVLRLPAALLFST